MQNLFLWAQRTNYPSAVYLPCTQFSLSILLCFLIAGPWICQKPFPSPTCRQALQGQWNWRDISNAGEHLSFPTTGHNLWKCSEQDSSITIDMIIVKIKYRHISSTELTPCHLISVLQGNGKNTVCKTSCSCRYHGDGRVIRYGLYLQQGNNSFLPISPRVFWGLIS